jgi:hypothetical protein
LNSYERPNDKSPDEAPNESLDEQVANSEPVMEEFSKSAKTDDLETLDQALNDDD